MSKSAVLLLLCAAASGSVRADRWIPSAARATGANGAVFVTDVRLLNASDADTATVQLVYYPAGKSAFTSVAIEIGPRQQRAFNNVIENLLGVPGDSSGPIFVVAPDAVQVSSRTYNVTDPCSGGTFGTSVPTLSADQATTAGVIAQVAGSADGKSGFRTNVIVTNPSDTETADVEVVLRRGEGGQLGVAGAASIPPHGVFQREVFAMAGAAGITTDNAFLEFTSTLPVFAFATVVDNRTNDASAYLATSTKGGLSVVKVGDLTTFSGSYGVSGKATVTSARTLRITGFNVGGAAPGLDLRIGRAAATRATFRVLQTLAKQTFLDATLDLNLPNGVDLTSFDTFTVYSYELGAVVAEGKFHTP